MAEQRMKLTVRVAWWVRPLLLLMRAAAHLGLLRPTHAARLGAAVVRGIRIEVIPG